MIQETTPNAGCRTPDATRSLCGFWALIVTQFQGAFSDNVLKWLVVFMILGMNVSSAELHRVGELVTALFSLPFILFSMAGGFFADRFSKRTISVSVKIFEMGVMLLALAGFWWNQIPMLLGCVFLMGVHSSFFGPSKYGLLPELLPERKLSWGNGLLELGTFMAIILGTVAAARMSKQFHGHQTWSGIILIALAVLGFITSLGITRVPAADPGRKFHANFLKDLFAQLRLVRRDRALTLAFLGNTYFFFLGQLLQLNVFFYGAQILHLDEIGIGQLSIALALGIGLGSAAAGYLSGGKIEYGLVPLGAFGMSLVSARAVRAGFVRERRARPAVVAWVHRRLFHRADRGVVATPAGPGEEGRGAGRREPAFVRGHFCRVRRVLFAGGRGRLVAGQDFFLGRCVDAGGRHLRFIFAAGRIAAVSALVRNAFALSDPDRRARPYPGQGRRAVCLQPRFLDGCAAADCFDRPAGAVSSCSRTFTNNPG